ncbi:MAG TPA: LemA family protein [Phycisphaerae bacterium]|nr:LemA family protein [Phycisphaerae bacterium]
MNTVAAGVSSNSWVVIAIAVGLIAFIWMIAIYNGLVRGRMTVREAWAQIEVQLKRRHELIPNLVETVKGYAGHEKETLNRVIEARNRAVGATTPAQAGIAEGMLNGALRQLFALSEAYPNLKANENFMQLSAELASTENQVSAARQYYNDAVGRYNSSIQIFPNVMFAGSLGFRPAEFFEVEDPAAREAPKVKFT